MRRHLLGATVLAVSTLAFAAPAHAAPTEPRDNTGYCVSDGFYGNQPNRDADGNVVPSQSPGPKRTLPDGTVIQGNSLGDYNSGRATGTPVNIAQLCHTLAG